MCYTVFGLVLARPSQNKLIWFSDAVLLFVVEWRQNEALATPILKNPTQLNNLLPVSNLHFISKLTERAIFDKIHSQNGLIRSLLNLTVRLP